MAKKTNFDPDSAFKSIVGEKEIPKNEPEKSVVNNVSKKLVRKTYYITEEQYKAIRVLAATSENPDEKDLSAIIRNALDLYLGLDKQN